MRVLAMHPCQANPHTYIYICVLKNIYKYIHTHTLFHIVLVHTSKYNCSISVGSLASVKNDLNTSNNIQETHAACVNTYV